VLVVDPSKGPQDRFRRRLTITDSKSSKLKRKSKAIDANKEAILLSALM